MQRTKKIKDFDENEFLKNYYHRFLFVDDVSKLKDLPPEIELCIIKTNFDKEHIDLIKKFKAKNKDTEFWLSSNNLSRENILIANKIGIKTVVSSPVNKKMVEEFFKKRANSFIGKEENNKNYDYSYIADSKIMLVDDNPMNVELLEEVLSKFNLKISKFLKPKEALKVAMTEKFDLFLLDVMMPEMSGFELSNRIKNTETNKDTPIIFISALSDAHTKIKGYDLGSFAYIEKPFDINIVKSQIFNLLKNKKDQALMASAKETFLATVAHDLKTPINAEINALNLLLNNNLGELEGMQKEIIQDILESSRFMQDLVENILCKNKIDNNQMTLARQVYSLKEIVEHCIDLTKYILNSRKQTVEFECNVIHSLLPIDFVEIKRAINNLISNASEYSPAEGKILIKIFEKKDNLCLSVQDFGRGMDIAQQKEAFSRYISYAKEFKRVGSGLGLYITKRIIESHNGKIKLESKLGYGTTITISLPLYVKD